MEGSPSLEKTPDGEDVATRVDPQTIAKLQANLERINALASTTNDSPFSNKKSGGKKFEDEEQHTEASAGRHWQPNGFAKPPSRVASYDAFTKRHECDCETQLSARDIKLRAVRRLSMAALKGFLIGTGLKGGLALFGVLSKLQRQLRQKGASGSGRRTSLEVGHAVRSTWRYGLFLGSFAGGFTAVDEIVAYVWGHKRTARWRALIGGALAGPALLLTGSHERHTSMAIYILIRAAVLSVRCGQKSKRFGWLFTPFGWQYGDALLMCISSLQILSAWILYPSTLPASYVNFLNKHGGKDLSIIQAVRDLAHRRRLDLSSVRASYAKHADVSFDPRMKIPCEVIHIGQQCGPHFVRFLKSAYARALPVYLPVYVFPALVVHRQNLLKRPIPILSKIALGTARSSLFLSVFCGAAWLCTCAVHQATGTCGPGTLMAGAFPAGLAVLLEKKSRRMELALYVLSRAIESFALCLSEWGYVRHQHVPKRLDVLLFSLATAVIMHCYAQERDVFRSKYLNVLDFVFGIPGVINSCGAPDCPVAKDASKALDVLVENTPHH